MIKKNEDSVPQIFSRKKKRPKKRKAGEHRDGWENLGQRGVVRLDANINGGIAGARTGDISSKAMPRIGRRLLGIGRSAKKRVQKVSRDGDGDKKITNPLTGRDDLPYVNPPDVPKRPFRVVGLSATRDPAPAPEDIELPKPNERDFDYQRLKFLSDVEPIIHNLVGGSIDSIEVDNLDSITSLHLRARIYYWNKRTGLNEIKTTYKKDGKFRAYVISGPLSGRSVKISGKMESGRLTNLTPYIGDDTLVQHQAAQTEIFRRWKQKDEWRNFHIEHYDWWTFPIDNGSSQYGFMYDISGEPLERLKKNVDYLESLRDASSMYLESLGWDMRSGLWIQNPRPNQTPTGNINQQRLFKIGRSLQIHELKDSFDSVRAFVDKLNSNGIRVGNKEYWDNPSKFVQKSRFKDSSGGISGKMAGISVQPTTFKGSPRIFDPEKDSKFQALWRNRDERNAKGDKSAGDLTFDWKNDDSRKSFIRRLWDKSLGGGYADFGNKISYGLKHSDSSKMGLGDVLKNNLHLIADLGLHWTPRFGKNGYPGFRNQYGVLFTHSLSAENPDDAAGAQARDMLGQFFPLANPREYWTQFEAWMRNPFITMRSTNGKEVGVRLYYNNDREKLIAEYNKRIARLYAAVAEGFGYDPADKPFTPPAGHKTPESFSEDDVRDFIRRQMDTLINSPELPMHQSPTVESLRKEIIAYLAGANDKIENSLAPITPEWFEEYIKRNHPGYLRDTMGKKPAFLRRTEADILDADQRRQLVELMSLILDGGEDDGKTAEEIKKIYFPEGHYTVGMIEDELSRQTSERNRRE